jgi:hypothetical protein
MGVVNESCLMQDLKFISKYLCNLKFADVGLLVLIRILFAAVCTNGIFNM